MSNDCPAYLACNSTVSTSVSPVLVYNLLLLTGIAASGLAMFVLAKRVTGNDNAAIVSAACAAREGYRITRQGRGQPASEGQPILEVTQ